MENLFDLFLNPIIISVICLCVLCIKGINVLLSIIISTLIAGFLSGMGVESIMDVFISGMGGNSETALSYILLGAFAATMAHSGFTDVFSQKITSFVKNNKYLLFLCLLLISIMSQNIIPIHIAFIPIIVPPLLNVMNSMKIDRRAVACVLAYGLKMPYIVIPAGFGLIFQNLIADNLSQNGVQILRCDIWKYTLILGIGMTVALLISLFLTYRKPRNYEDSFNSSISQEDCSFNRKYWILIFAALATFIVQLITKSLPLGALVGLGIIFTCKVVPQIKWII